MSAVGLPVSAGDLSAGAWRRSLALLALALAILGILYRDTVLAMVTIWWRSETFQHCFVVPPIVLWLIWRRRAHLAQMAPCPAWLPLLPAAVIGFGWLLGALTAVNALTQFAFVAQLVLAVPALLGWRVARAIAFPLGFSFLAVPFGEFIMPTMMESTADFTVLALRASGIVVYREGLHFNIPSGAWSVVEACSGVRYLIASFTVGLLFAYLNYRSLRKRLVFIAVAIAVPVFANWLRAYMIVMLGHLSGNKLATGVDHLIYGWVFFGAVIMIMFAIGARWSEDTLSESPAEAAAHASPSEVANLRPGAQVAACVAFLAVTAAPVWANAWILGREVAAPAVLEMPAEAADWRRQAGPLASWEPEFDNPSATFHGAYVREGAAVGLYVGYYRNQNFDRKLVSSSNVLVKNDDKVWARVSAGSAHTLVGSRTIDARIAELRSLATAAPGRERLVVRHWYWIDGHLTASDREAKLRTAWSRLTGRGDDSAVVIVYAFKDAPGGGDPAIAAFASAAGGAVEDALFRTKEAR